MIDLQLIENLNLKLQQSLPGLNAQLEMTSLLRGQKWEVREDHRKSGVLLCLYPQADQWHIALMKRTQDEGVHSGQISFPGGRFEDSDRNYTHTALREAEEELGIPQQEVQVLGALTELYISPSNFMVYPTVGYMLRRPAFVLDPKEVAELIEVEIDLFLQEEIRKNRRIKLGQNMKIEVPTFLVKGHIIWGATAMILNEFLHLWRELPQ